MRSQLMSISKICTKINIRLTVISQACMEPVEVEVHLGHVPSPLPQQASSLIRIAWDRPLLVKVSA